MIIIKDMVCVQHFFHMCTYYSIIFERSNSVGIYVGSFYEHLRPRNEIILFRNWLAIIKGPSSHQCLLKVGLLRIQANSHFVSLDFFLKSRPLLVITGMIF